MLPSVDLAPADFEYTFLHELTHYKRRDMYYKWFVQLVICLHWFNPLVYVMGREVGRACELACDESVIKRLDAKGRRGYGDTLINAIGAGTYKDTLASVTLYGNKRLLKERLEAIMIYHKKTKLSAAISFVLTITLACGSAAIGAYAAPASKEDTTAAMPISNRIIREGGVYYIFCGDADESDKPISGVAEGSINFVLVRKDGYTSIGPFQDLDRLNDELTEQCEYMLKAQSITREEANLIISAAAKVQPASDKKEAEDKADSSPDKEYAEWEIEKVRAAYYYKSQRVRIFMDLRENNSFVNFNYDRQGTVDLRLTCRSSIKSICVIRLPLKYIMKRTQKNWQSSQINMDFLIRSIKCMI